jgi:hypothetical protein
MGNEARSSIFAKLNKLFWAASIGVWVWLVIGLAKDLLTLNPSWDVIWVNSAFFLAAGIGVVATTNFLASALPLFLGLMTITSNDVKGGALFSFLYVVTATVIGSISLIARLAARSFQI